MSASSRDRNSALGRGALQALQAAALLLPGLSPAITHAASAEDQLNLQTSHYEEGRRDLGPVRSTLAPLQADTLRLSGSRALGATRTVNFALSQDTWSGATPISTAPLAADPNRAILRNTPAGVISSGASPYLSISLPLTTDGVPLQQQADGTRSADARQVLVLSSASPELRQQADVTLNSEHQGFDTSVGLSLSSERDYLGRGISAGVSRDFNQQLTTLSLGASYSSNDIRARLDPDALPYLDRSAWQARLVRDQGTERLFASRHDSRVELGLTQVLNAKSFVEAALGYGRAEGYLGNPYKAVSVLFSPPTTGAIRNGELRALMEKRPDTQYQTQLSLHYAHALPFAGGAMHLDYQYSRDSWDLDTHSVEWRWVQPLGSWTFTPHLRWYGQSQADFYSGYLRSDQAWRSIVTDAHGRQVWTSSGATTTQYFRTSAGDFLDAQGRLIDTTSLDLQPLQQGYDAALLPTHYSSDHRLASFGSVNGGFTLGRRFSNGVVLEAGLDLYRRRGAWGLEGGENNDFADFRFAQFNVGLQLDFGARARAQSMAAMPAMAHGSHDAGSDDAAMHMPPIPAGVGLAHPMHTPGALSFAYQVQSTRQGGALRSGERTITDATVVATGCGTSECRYAPAAMTMQMHMFMFTYQWRDDLSFMLMPQYMNMDMQLRELRGRPANLPGEHVHGPGGHQIGGIGDTVVAASWQPAFFGDVQLSLGLSIPTGKTDLEYRRQMRTDGGLVHFHMQTGSGTWDLAPALTWQQGTGAWHYGAQLSSVSRLQNQNDSGYRLGGQWQATTWAGHSLNDWLTGSVRLTHTRRGEISGDFNAYNARLGPMDYPQNEGGRYTDLGLGFSVALPRGQQLAMEWELPLIDTPHGIQLERESQWTLSWHGAW